MGTLREFLESEGFNYKVGIIIYQEVDGNYPGWTYSDVDGVVIEWDNPVLDMEFETGYGGPHCPRFVASDDVKIYFPVQYDGATWCESIYLDIREYIKKPTPYPGG